MTPHGPATTGVLPSVWRILAVGPLVGLVLAVALRTRVLPLVLATSGFGAVLAGLWGATITVRDDWRRAPVGRARVIQVVGCFAVGLLLLVASGPRPAG